MAAHQTSPASPADPVPAATRPSGNPPARRLLLLAFVVSPLAVLVILILVINQAMQSGAKMRAMPRGAGAGQTGMYNQHMKADPAAARPAPQPAPAPAPAEPK